MQKVLAPLPNDFSIPIAVVRHQSPSPDNYVIEALNDATPLLVKFAEDFEKPRAGCVYLAPPDRHLLFNLDGTFSLSRGAKVNYSRPSIDVLFKSTYELFGPFAVGAILTGANRDGAEGLLGISERGGLTIVQDPATAEEKTMPLAAVSTVGVDYITSLEQIGPLLWDIQRRKKTKVEG